MKKIAVTTFAFIGALTVSSAAFAEGIGFVDLAKLEMKSTAFQSIVAQRDKTVKTYGKRFEEIEKSLREKEAAIAKEKDSLSQAEIGKRIDALKADLEKYKVQREEFAKQMQEAMIASLKEIQDKAVTPVLKTIAEEKKFDAILNLNQALYVGKNDVTEEVITKVNAKLPKVDMPKINLSVATKK